MNVFCGVLFMLRNIETDGFLSVPLCKVNSYCSIYTIQCIIQRLLIMASVLFKWRSLVDTIDLPAQDQTPSIQ